MDGWMDGWMDGRMDGRVSLMILAGGMMMEVGGQVAARPCGAVWGSAERFISLDSLHVIMRNRSVAAAAWACGSIFDRP